MGREEELGLAARTGDIKKVKKILKYRINLEATLGGIYPKYYTALMYASFNGNPRIVKILIKAGANVNAVDRSKQTVLMHASLNGYLGIVKILIKAGADKHAECDGALRIAQRKGYKKIVKYIRKSEFWGGY